MKANELKVTDLMVGDWVMSFGAPHKVVGIRTDMFEPHIRTDMSDTWYEEGIENLLEPIPLTPEILEKNGWKEEGFFYRSEDFNGHIQLGKLFEHASIVTHDCRINLPPYRMKCVHQLQHALRLCGINKEIEL